MFSATDIAWLAANYPLLSASASRVEGRIHMRMLYQGESGYVLNPGTEQLAAGEGTFHEDDYEVQILWPFGARYPSAEAKDQKIAAVRAAKKLSAADVHLQPDGKTFCLATPQELEQAFGDGFSIELYFNRFLIPYFFLQTHYRKTGDWLWDTASHGLVGVLEWYESGDGSRTCKGALMTGTCFASLGLTQLLMYKPKGHYRCICGRRATIRKCHPKALKTLRRLYVDLKGYGVNQSFWERQMSAK